MVLAVVLLTAPLCGSAKIVINTWGGPFTAATENGECQCISEYVRVCVRLCVRERCESGASK